MRFPVALLAAVAVFAIGFPLSAAARGTFETTVTIKGPGGDFSGQVKSSNSDCRADRTVKVFKKKKNGKNLKIGTDTTESNGAWSTGNSGFKRGKFYAKSPAAGDCEKGKSKTITLG